MKFNLNEIRKFAGLPQLKEAMMPATEPEVGAPETSAPEAETDHEQSEQELFQRVHDDLETVVSMCEQRLSGDQASDEEKTQYSDLVSSAKHCLEVMKQHLGSEEADTNDQQPEQPAAQAFTFSTPLKSL